MVYDNMNILVLNYEFPPIGGGASPVSFDISRHLVERGHKITVVTMQYKKLPKHEFTDGMEIFRVPCIRAKANVCHPWEQLTYIFSATCFLYRYLKNHSVDVVHTHFIIPTGIVAWILKKKCGLPYIITAHGSDVLGHNNKRFKILYWLLKHPWCAIVRQAEAIVSPSNHLIELMKKNETEAKYVLIQNGIETALYKNLPKKRQILFMGRLQETKEIQTLIRAIAKVDMQQWHLNIVGDGPYRSELENLVSKLGIQDKVSFCGWIKNRSQEQILKLGEAAVYISASRVENCPVSVLEALCSGCQVLVSDIPGHRELLKDNAEYFECGNASALAKKIQRIIEKGIVAQSIDAKIYDWKNIIVSYEKIMKDIRK